MGGGRVLGLCLSAAVVAAVGGWARPAVATGLPEALPSGYELVFEDNFDGDRLDRGRWCTRYAYGGGPAIPDLEPACGVGGRGTLDYLAGSVGHPEQQRYVDRNQKGEPLHVVADGVLRLKATRSRKDEAAPYESAMIRSKFTLKPDSQASYYLAARLRLPEVRGTWPAFWLVPGIGPDGKAGWPPEIDIVEAPLNDKWDTSNMLIQHAQQQAWGGKGSKGGAPATAFDGVFVDGKIKSDRNLRGVWLDGGLEWDAEKICFYLDGRKTACAPYAWKHNDGTEAPPATIILNLAIGGWAGRNGIDADKFPTSFDIDFVRVYRRQLKP